MPILSLKNEDNHRDEVCLRNFKGVGLLIEVQSTYWIHFVFRYSKYKHLKYIVLGNVDLYSLLNKYFLSVKYHIVKAVSAYIIPIVYLIALMNLTLRIFERTNKI